MDYAAYFFIQVVYAIASLALISVGLAVIYGMMRVINFAHGEFLMLGGYAVILPVQAGFNLWISMLIIAPLSVGLFGIVVERLIIRPLYGRVIDTVLATWGLSLLLIGLDLGNTRILSGRLETPARQPRNRRLSRERLYVLCDRDHLRGDDSPVSRDEAATAIGLLARGTMQSRDGRRARRQYRKNLRCHFRSRSRTVGSSRAPVSRQSRVWFQSSELPISPRHSSLSSAEAQRRSPVQCRPLSYSALSIRR